MDTVIKCKKGELIIKDDFLTYGNTNIEVSDIYMFIVLGAFSRHLEIHYKDQVIKIDVKKEGEEQIKAILDEMNEKIVDNYVRYFEKPHDSEELFEFIKFNKLCNFDVIKKAIIPCFDYARKCITTDEKVMFQCSCIVKKGIISGDVFIDSNQIYGAVTITNKRLISCYYGTYLGKTTEIMLEVNIDQHVKLYEPNGNKIILHNSEQNVSLLVELGGIINSQPITTIIKRLVKENSKL